MSYTINIYIPILLWIYYSNFNTVNSLIIKIIETNPYLKNKLIEYSWHYMKIKTVTEKKYNYLSKKINNIIHPLLTLIFEKEEEQNILFIKDGSLLDKTSYMYIKKYNKNTDYDMILYEWKIPESDKYDNYILRFEHINNVNDKFKTSKVSLLAVELCIKRENKVEEVYAIDFKKNNYYIVNNVLFDKNFLTYWCNNVLKTELNDSYEVSFFDNNMTHHTLKNTDSIKILSDDFEIISSN